MIVNRSCRALLVTGLLAVRAAGALVAQCTNCSQPAERLCGPRCLLAVCEKLGVQANLDELTTLCGTDEHGTSMLRLQEAAKAKGLQAAGMKIGLSELTGLKVLTIAYCWNDHFVLVEPADDHNLLVSDPPGKPEVIAEKDFQEGYTGFAVLVSKDSSAFPKTLTNGPDIRFKEYEWDFGSIVQGTTQSHSFTVENVGDKDLIILKVEPSCTCVTLRTFPVSIPAGGTDKISVLFDSDDSMLGQSRDIRITSNDPISPITHLAVRGYVKPRRLLFSPRAVNFGTVRKGDQAKETIYVPSDVHDPISVTHVSSKSPYVDVSCQPSPDKSVPGTIVTLALKPDAPVGKLDGEVTIQSTHALEPVAKVALSAIISGSIDLDRDAFYFGVLKKSQAVESAITVSRTEDMQFKIESAVSSLPYLSVKITPKTAGREYVLTGTLRGDAPLGNIKGEVILHTDDPDQGEIRVPVFAFVEE